MGKDIEKPKPARFWILRSVGIIVVLLLAFPGYYLGKGVQDYWNGTARLKGVGYPGSEFHNLDREVRVYWRSTG